uniref:KIB1-4 beta-propeller domain-containing protein n=1 Tax=Fagus sylvatica TaxID=28930 RepID=A0A2N9I1Y4_FAGSY
MFSDSAASVIPGAPLSPPPPFTPTLLASLTLLAHPSRSWLWIPVPAYLCESSLYRLQRLNPQTPDEGLLLIKVEESNLGNLRLLDPYRNRYEVVSLNLLDFRVLEFTKAYTLKCQCNCQPPTRGAIVINKVLKFPNSARTNVNDCAVFIVYSTGILSFAKCGDENLTRVGDRGIKYEDIIVYEGLFYVVDSLGRVWWIREPLELVEFMPRLPPSDGWMKYLVESCGALYVVDRGLHHFLKVYKMDRDKPEPWDLVNSLGDRAFVLGIDCCFSVSTEEFYGFKRNCIYFTDIRSVFNLEDDRFEYLAPLPNLL